MHNYLLKYKGSLAKTSRTAKLWLQYIEYVEAVKLFIQAERTENWNLHLIAVEKMMNLFAATGHINYAKSFGFYLQLMPQNVHGCINALSNRDVIVYTEVANIGQDCGPIWLLSK